MNEKCSHEDPNFKAIRLGTRRGLPNNFPRCGSVFGPFDKVNSFGASQTMTVIVISLMACLLKINESPRHQHQLGRRRRKQRLPRISQARSTEALRGLLHSLVLEGATKHMPQTIRVEPTKHRSGNIFGQQMKQRIIGCGYCSTEACLFGPLGFLSGEGARLIKQIGRKTQEATLSSLSFRKRTNTHSEIPLSATVFLNSP